jgi:hypothetical protein
MRPWLMNFPHYVTPEAYEDAIHHMVEKLSGEAGVVSIFQIGNLHHPGISDIDMMVVLEDGVEFHLNPLQGLSKTERYLFLHTLFGISRNDFHDAQHYTFFHNYRLLWGETFPIREKNLSPEEMRVLKTQTAIEYLVQMYITMTVQRTYGIFWVRELLLHARALFYDFEFLNVSSGRLYELILTLMEWRNNWFEIKPEEKCLREWIDDCYKELSEFLKRLLQTEKFYVPEGSSLQVAKNITLSQSNQFSYAHHGVMFPPLFRGLGKKYFKVQRKLNRFVFFVPIEKKEIPSVLRIKYDLEYRMVRFTADKHFLPVKSPLNFMRKLNFQGKEK